MKKSIAVFRKIILHKYSQLTFDKKEKEFLKRPSL